MDSMMKRVVDKMRTDFDLVAKERIARGEWTEADAQEIGAAIKVHIDSEDVVNISLWSSWLADLAAAICAWSLIVRRTEARMRDAARQVRESQGKKVA